MSLAQGSKDSFLFAAHDGVNLLIFFFLISLPYVSTDLLVGNYQVGKILHLLGLLWFYGGLILSSFCLSRFVWTQPSLNHNKLAYGYRVILVLEFWCIPSIALMAYGGMAMVSQIGGLESHLWAYYGYLFLLATPPILMIIPRLYHKRLINNEDINIHREQHLALWQDWFFIFMMTVIIAVISSSMVWKTVFY
jgi:hypothetical protein